jgi:hypothetical protein
MCNPNLIKTIQNSIILSIAGISGLGTSGAGPAFICFCKYDNEGTTNPKRKQEIGTWRISRHKIFRILS